MIVQAPDQGVKSAKPHDCGCGCGGKCGCESRCCDLECLVRPNFFCGQLLTDADLGAMVDWARNRFALSRYRHGWGVVCGLDVTCTSPAGTQDCCPDPHTGPIVYVNPGYAIDCCGNDLVVCDPIAVDLSKVCRPLKDPCDQPPKPNAPDPTSARGHDQKVGAPAEKCWAIPRDQLVAVDLTLRYHEDLSHGQRAMFRSGCSDVGPCEYTRVLERPCVQAEVGALEVRCGDDDDAKAWEDGFTDRRTRTFKEIGDAMRKGVEGVLQYLRRHPPYRFCFLEDFVCCLLQEGGDTNQSQDPGWRTRVHFWLYYDWLLHELECPCWSCRPDPGVPLARVLLRRFEERGQQQCRVMLIDTSAPHRRPLRKDECRPIARGAIDLAPYLWQPGRAAVDRLRLLGLRVHEEVLLESDLVSRAPQALLSLEAAANRRLRVLLVRDPFDCERVAAFEREDKR